MSVSLDGFVETPNRPLDWVIVDEELHPFFNDEAREMGAFPYGRRVYELMTGYWPTAATIVPIACIAWSIWLIAIGVFLLA